MTFPSTVEVFQYRFGRATPTITQPTKPKIKATTSRIGSMIIPRGKLNPAPWFEDFCSINSSFCENVVSYFEGSVSVCASRLPVWVCPAPQICIMIYMTPFFSSLLPSPFTNTKSILCFFFFCFLHPWNWTGVYRLVLRVQWSCVAPNDTALWVFIGSHFLLKYIWTQEELNVTWLMHKFKTF